MQTLSSLLFKDTQFWGAVEPFSLSDFFAQGGVENYLLFRKKPCHTFLDWLGFRLFVAAKTLEFVASVSLGSTISTHNQEDV